jgi:hypothetical protein
MADWLKIWSILAHDHSPPGAANQQHSDIAFASPSLGDGFSFKEPRQTWSARSHPHWGVCSIQACWTICGSPYLSYSSSDLFAQQRLTAMQERIGLTIQMSTVKTHGAIQTCTRVKPHCSRMPVLRVFSRSIHSQIPSH